MTTPAREQFEKWADKCHPGEWNEDMWIGWQAAPSSHKGEEGLTSLYVEKLREENTRLKDEIFDLLTLAHLGKEARYDAGGKRG